MAADNSLAWDLIATDAASAAFKRVSSAAERKASDGR
jgi:hypothetical protein